MSKKKTTTENKTPASEKAILSYKPEEIEAFWQEKWEEKAVYKPDMDKAKRSYYNLMMFPYPSAEGLHVGNVYAFTGSDIYGRFMRMRGYDVFEPIGLDGFGIHSENYALKVGRHPVEQAKISEVNFYRQLRSIGNGFDWGRAVETYDPDYYKWTQWIFLQLYKAGLAYRKKAPVNFCPKDLTVLADEQVIDGCCERCGSVVEKRELEQWFFKITSYAEKLLEGLDRIDWTEKVKIAQRQWIGKKVGINIAYQIEGREEKIMCFTTRPDTNFGATFIVIGPEHPQTLTITKAENKKAVEEYIAKTKHVSEAERISQGRKKTGAFTGNYVINNLNGKRLPIWVSDFVIGNVGTGAVVGVPGHDLRDFEFAKEFDLPIIRVVVGKAGDRSEITKPQEVQEEEGVMINSEFLNGLDIHKATIKIMDYLVAKGWGEKVTSYHLRDWLISRQRYWGPPIPMIYCKTCALRDPSGQGWQPVPEKDLPVLLPEIADWKPKGTGKSPLANIPEFVHTTCPKCGGKAERETDVSDNFLDSAWYFYRYTSTDEKKHAWIKKRVETWLPVHMYIGGAEHSVLHLLYSRFLTKVFKDIGLISHFDEPFTRFYAHGLIIKEGTKMSKSKGNVIVPDAYIKKYGADTLRVYLMFLGPFNAGGDFQDSGIEGVHRFLKRVWTLVNKHKESTLAEKESDEGRKIRHKTIKRVTKDLEKLRYNTAIAALMEYYNALTSGQYVISPQDIDTLLLLLAPFAPHMTEDLWQRSLGLKIQGAKLESIHQHPWPLYNQEYLIEGEVVIAIQVNGKLRDIIKVKNSGLRIQNDVEEKARKSEKIQRSLQGKTLKKVVYVEGKILNFVVG